MRLVGSSEARSRSHKEDRECFGSPLRGSWLGVCNGSRERTDRSDFLARTEGKPRWGSGECQCDFLNPSIFRPAPCLDWRLVSARWIAAAVQPVRGSYGQCRHPFLQQGLPHKDAAVMTQSPVVGSS